MEDAMQTLFFTLGFLDEYGGRVIRENSDQLEGFYESERDKAEIFKASLFRLVEEWGIETTIRSEVIEGNYTVFHSRELTDLVNRYYKFDFACSGYVTLDSEARC